MKPQRIQLKRTRGWKMPPNTVSVARPGPWGNPWKIGLVACGCRSAGECNHNSFRAETAAQAVEFYRDWINMRLSGPKASGLRGKLAALKGMNLACWCKPGSPCHADVLLELANRNLP